MLALYRLCTVDWGAIGIRKETVGAAVATSVHLFSYHNEANAFLFKFETAELLQFPKFLLDSIKLNDYWRNPIIKFKHAVSNSQNCLMRLHKGSGLILLTYLTRVKRVQLLSLSHIAVTTILMLVRIVTATADATVVFIPGFSDVCVQTLMSQNGLRTIEG